ncbi:MAG: RagB/SusD family nutrient uptake outer membrane protein [Tannerellaceae bacterium]|jgi:hypothetical protein|nr:RagB/SusD family nutrient uptake outer membrane protein [Tannerellaceae bacterium]
MENKLIYKQVRKRNISMVFVLLAGICCSCSGDFLDEVPLSSLSAENTLVSKNGFESYLTGLVRSAREEYAQNDNTFFITNFPGTDIGEDAGAEYFTYRNWISYLTPNTPEVKTNWVWAYTKVIPLANNIIVYANKPELSHIWESEAEKNAVIAEARFFRGYTYNLLANLYGGVPVVDSILNAPKYDYVRASREEVYAFAKNDLDFASKWLPAAVAQKGRIVKAAADHLLTEVNISLGLYEEAIASASNVINSGIYHLMKERFGSSSSQPGDVFSDLFENGNFNSPENKEAIYVWQIEPLTPGGGGSVGGNQSVRNCGPFQTKIVSPDGYSNVATDMLGRGVGRVRGTVYSLYTVWDDPDDIRNSEFNMRRTFYYNNPNSAYYGQEIPPLTNAEDTLRLLYAYPRKIEGLPWNSNNTSGQISDDVYVYRLAETYLLRAEAYFKNNQLQEAADDINAVRNRAHAAPVHPSQVNLDFILDERSRELLFEEPRRRTLIRMGVLVERVKKYGLMEDWRNTVQDYQGLWPIPQSAIDANLGIDLGQNPGYTK